MLVAGHLSAPGPERLSEDRFVRHRRLRDVQMGNPHEGAVAVFAAWLADQVLGLVDGGVGTLGKKDRPAGRAVS
jgi:hypothetical protein